MPEKGIHRIVGNGFKLPCWGGRNRILCPSFRSDMAFIGLGGCATSCTRLPRCITSTPTTPHHSKRPLGGNGTPRLRTREVCVMESVGCTSDSGGAMPGGGRCTAVLHCSSAQMSKFYSFASRCRSNLGVRFKLHVFFRTGGRVRVNASIISRLALSCAIQLCGGRASRGRLQCRAPTGS